MSPKRSTPETDERQRRAVERYARHRGLHVEPAPGGAYAPVDAVLKASDRLGAEAVEVVEVKCRSATSERFDTIWLEERKAVALRRWADIYACEAVFLVEWGDGRLFWVPLAEALHAAGEPVVRRRQDRDDPLDTDIVYEVPTRLLREVP